MTTPLLLICLALVSAGVRGQPESTAEIEPVAIAIHGGAGTISRESLTAERERTIREALEEAIRAGHAVLEKDGAAVDA
ncbi:MAG: isoaspartyl peptidase/L-asparaginase, partial [Wenzhouxiangellaceae bacterium]|nr:isoaspartyl peptidase/L-asparaginase [Wenzhouxiangellaceae bacterium]